MHIRTIAKQTAAALLVAIFMIGGAAQASAKPSNYFGENKTYGISHITRFDMSKIPDQQENERFQVPEFDESTIENLPSAVGKDKDGKEIDLDVWDSWPLQNADGTVADYKEYNIVFALAGDPKIGSDTFIYLFYQKKGDTSIDSWKNAGRVFQPDDHLKANDPILKDQSEEWSGSATLTKDGKVRLFYTNRHPWNPDKNLYGRQTLTTAQINLSQPDADSLKIDGTEDLKSIFDGDGKYYQTVEQGIEAENFSDNHTLRDPHYVEDKGRKYLVFEANTGKKVGYQGEDQFNNRAYYGGGLRYFQKERKALLDRPKKKLASLANGALGIIELNNDYTLKKVMKPLIASNTVTDEIERANVFKMNGKWYLFTDSRGAKMTIDGIGDKDVYMLGYVSNSLTGMYHPLNGSGLVLQMGLDTDDITWTYSHFAVPQKRGNKVVITSYMTNRGTFDDQHSTFAPSFLVKLQGSRSSVVPDSILDQGQLTVDQ
ncbi:glycoside hydrolase family 68 protein [Sporolactobacillus shoreicorticis]|uniref:Glycoside hydrolase family 68 protein n=1 Tax=Sporolactobacillus shoreicorticis TaxID=1923877 RepID=A0ABW5S3S9_9BACL|nr:glycoside hydrolase family 68 protein [Sporolactobacillus shoreicorticis]MCO7127062.1 glycoside hydrolase family 68 protein [Sporolactobacillus shoreicorticis]